MEKRVSPADDVERASSLCLSPPAGRIAGLFGAGAHRLALRALVRPLLAGETAVAVDGGGLFDPYEISRAEKASGGSGKTALSRVFVSRAFTCHQMEALLSRRLAPALARSGAGLALVLGLPETFADADVPYAEACRVFRGGIEALRRVAAGGARVVLAGGGEGARAGFFRHLVRIADPLLLLRREEDELRWTFLQGEAPRRRLAEGVSLRPSQGGR